MTREEIIKELRCLASGEDCPNEKCDNTCPYWTEIERGAALYDDRQLCRAAADMLEQDAHFAGVGKMVTCKDCAHLCYEDIGVYYCGLHRIAGQLDPDDYCDRGARKEKQRNAATD